MEHEFKTYVRTGDQLRHFAAPVMLVEKEISQATLRKDLNIATGTMRKLRRNEEVALSVLLRICEYLDCNIGDICDAVREGE